MSLVAMILLRGDKLSNKRKAGTRETTMTMLCV
jgi:hypothetical protein